MCLLVMNLPSNLVNLYSASLTRRIPRQKE
jgi:hypothetical protein